MKGTKGLKRRKKEGDKTLEKGVGITKENTVIGGTKVIRVNVSLSYMDRETLGRGWEKGRPLEEQISKR